MRVNLIKMFVAAIAVAAPLLVANSAAAEWSFQSGNWQGKSYANEATGQFTHCAMGTSYLSGDYLIFSLSRDGRFGISVVNASWQLSAGDHYPISIEIDRYRPVAAQANVVSPTQALTAFQDAYQLFQNVRRGRTMKIRTTDGMLNYDLTGTSRALQQVATCLYSELDRETAASHPTANPFAAQSAQPVSAGAGTDSGPMDRTELVILASNVLAEAGVTGHRFLSDQERTGAFAGMDVAWIGPGDSAGGLTGVRMSGSENLQTALTNLGPAIAANDATACTGRFASLPGQLRFEGGAFRLDLQTACDGATGVLTVDYSFFGMADGRLLRFTIYQLAGERAKVPVENMGPEIVPANFVGAAARVVQVVQ